MVRGRKRKTDIDNTEEKEEASLTITPSLKEQATIAKLAPKPAIDNIPAVDFIPTPGVAPDPKYIEETVRHIDVMKKSKEKKGQSVPASASNLTYPISVRRMMERKGKTRK